MTADRSTRNRQSIRNPQYDYTSAGAYFVTTCTQERECLLHDPVVMGIIHDVWQALPSWFPTIALDEFVVMPNHVHLIIWFQWSNSVGATLAVARDAADANRAGASFGPAGEAGLSPDPKGHSPAPTTGDTVTREWVVPSPTTPNLYPRLGDVVGTFKSLVFAVYLEWIEQHEPTRRARFWQRNYYEQVIRGNKELHAIRQYITENPARWQLDRDNPSNLRHGAAPTSVKDYLAEIECTG
jgi:putative transposase